MKAENYSQRHTKLLSSELRQMSIHSEQSEQIYAT